LSALRGSVKTKFARNKQRRSARDRRSFAGRRFMELWQQQGFDSFGDWRRAAEKTRRAAKKAQASTIASPAPSSTARRVEAVTASWHPPELIQPPAVTNSPLKRTDQHRAGDLVPGDLHEHVQVTPRGSRAHTMTHASPGGTFRVKQHVSPPGSPNLNRVQKVDTWQQQVAHERRTRADARADEELYRNKRIATDEWLQSLRRWDPQTHRVSRRKTVAVVLE
jgi:hypothetical protein